MAGLTNQLVLQFVVRPASPVEYSRVQLDKLSQRKKRRIASMCEHLGECSVLERCGPTNPASCSVLDRDSKRTREAPRLRTHLDREMGNPNQIGAR